MRLSWWYRKQGIGLTKRLDILREAVVIFDDVLARRKHQNTETNEEYISLWLR